MTETSENEAPISNYNMGPFARSASAVARSQSSDRGTSGSVESAAAFPFSHSRSDSTYSLARTSVVRRTNSIRNSKDIIPLVLRPERHPSDSSAPPSNHPPPPSHGHRRVLSMGLYRADTAPPPQDQQRQKRASRPGSVFLGRRSTARDADVDCHNPAALSPTSIDVLQFSYQDHHQPHNRLLSRPPSTAASRTHTANNDPNVPRPPILAAGFPLPASRTLSSVERSTQQCSCAAERVKVEARQGARITELETKLETKDLTISMLSEQLEDKNQELDLLRQRMALLEKTMADHSSPAVIMNSPFPRIECDFGVDEGIGSTGSASSRPASRAESSTLSATPPQETERKQKRISLNSIDPDLSYEDLIGENVALKEEVVRLNNVLEDGLGALADLGL